MVYYYQDDEDESEDEKMLVKLLNLSKLTEKNLRKGRTAQDLQWFLEEDYLPVRRAWEALGEYGQSVATNLRGYLALEARGETENEDGDSLEGLIGNAYDTGVEHGFNADKVTSVLDELLMWQKEAAEKIFVAKGIELKYSYQMAGV